MHGKRVKSRATLFIDNVAYYSARILYNKLTSANYSEFPKKFIIIQPIIKLM